MFLAIDTSTSMVGIAVHDGTSILGEKTWLSQNRHTTVLASAVKELLEAIMVDKSRLTGIAVAIGPGSFTSLRVGISFAKGIALGLEVPVIGVPTLDILAAAQPVNEIPLCTVLQAGRDRLAVQFYKKEKAAWKNDSEIEVFTAERLAETIQNPTSVCGELSADARGLLKKQNKNIRLAAPAISLRRPGFLAEIAWKHYIKGDYPPPSGLAPIYLRTKDPIPE